MLKIFAKHETDEKALVACSNEQVRGVQLRLAETYGGNWLRVDKIKPDEVLHFNDGLIYNGFNPKIDRYCKFIKKI